MHYLDEGSGPAITWIHGFPLSGEVFRHQLAIPNARHIVPDLPGFGRSRSEIGKPSLDDYAREVLALLDRLQIDRSVFAGLSMGGYICFSIARLAPERMRGLILIDTRETPDTDEARKGRYDTIEKVKEKGISVVVDSMLPKMLTAGAPQTKKDEVKAIMQSCSRDGVTDALRAMAERGDSTDLLTRISVPALIVVGEEDGITPPADAERMGRALKNATVVMIPGAAHLSNIEQPEIVNRAVSDFLAGL